MTRHVMTLIWNRKRANGLILVELLACFIVLCAVFSAGLDMARRWQYPLGFDITDRWEVDVSGANFFALEDEEAEQATESFRQLRRAVGDLPMVEQATLVFNAPLSHMSSITETLLEGQRVRMQQVYLEPEALEVLGLEMVAGRWLERGDELLEFTPVVIDQDMGRRLFGGDDPLGQLLPTIDRDGQVEEADSPEDIRRIVGMVSAYRKEGRLGDDRIHAALALNRKGRDYTAVSNIVFKVSPGTPRAFEEQLLATLRGINPDWNYNVMSYGDKQADRQLQQLMPLILAGVVAGFLIIMVGLGLVGVLWQAVIRRTREMGLRRALGATDRGVRGQIITELMALTMVAVALGTVLFLQAPLLGLTGTIGYPVLILAVVLAMVVLASFVAICGLYPSWLATRVEPARALQYE